MGGMNTKERFMQAVRLLAPGDQFILRAARDVREETLPLAPGGAALEFVAAMEKLKRSEAPLPLPAKALPRGKQGQAEPPTPRQSGAASWKQEFERAEAEHGQLPLPHALRVKSAELWLKLSQPVQALLELNRLPDTARKHPWVLRVFLSALRQAWDLNEYPAHAE